MKLDLDEIVQTFLAESEEDLGKMEQALLALETHPGDAELVKTIFRAVHTMKGNAAALGFGSTAEFAHALEDLLDRVRSRSAPVTKTLITLLLQALDGLRELMRGAAAGKDELDDRHRDLIARFGDSTLQVVVERVPTRSLAEAAAAPAPPSAVLAAPKPVVDEPRAMVERARTLRVDIERLDELLNLAGEIAIARGQLADMLEVIGGSEAREVLEAHREADRLHSDLQELVMKVRLVPIGSLFRQLSRVVRDLTESAGKLARLETDGDDVEVDTAIVENLRDPLTHMIRNAVDHGIEAPELRRAKGKPAEARILIKAYHDGSSVIVQVIDDGAGLDRKRILERGLERGLITDPQALSDAEIYELVFEPGFSTARSVTELSGRGVGMDVVRRNVEALRGSVSISSKEGQGTTVTLRVPLTLAIIQGFRVGVAAETYVVPVDAVIECIELSRADVARRAARGAPRGVLNLRGDPLPYIRLRDLFGIRGDAPPRENLLVVRYPGGRAGLVVDALYGESQIVIKSLGRLFHRVRGVTGSAILGSGRVALILDVAALLRGTMAEHPRAEAS